jgi:hypothetical protein
MPSSLINSGQPSWTMDIGIWMPDLFPQIFPAQIGVPPGKNRRYSIRQPNQRPLRIFQFFQASPSVRALHEPRISVTQFNRFFFLIIIDYFTDAAAAGRWVPFGLRSVGVKAVADQDMTMGTGPVYFYPAFQVPTKYFRVHFSLEPLPTDLDDRRRCAPYPSGEAAGKCISPDTLAFLGEWTPFGVRREATSREVTVVNW